MSPTSPALADGSLTQSHLGCPIYLSPAYLKDYNEKIVQYNISKSLMSSL